jgi:hypothetical protein
VRLAVHHVGIARRLALGVDQDARVDLVPFVLGHPYLAHGDGAGGHVEQQRRLALGAGQGDAHRVGDEARVGAAERRHDRAMVGNVHEVQGDEAGRAGQLAVGADPADVVCVGQRHGHHTGLAAALDGGRHRLLGHAPAVPTEAVEHERGPVVLHDLGPRVRHHQARVHVAHVGRDHPHAVTVVPGQVGGDQVRGDEIGLLERTATGLDDGAGDAAQPIGRRAHATRPRAGAGPRAGRP